ncbi:MAG: hypothetical protein ACRBN8_24300 [Nannocystales bacterium]
MVTREPADAPEHEAGGGLSGLAAAGVGRFAGLELLGLLSMVLSVVFGE